MKHFEFTEEEAKIPFFEKKINPVSYILFIVGVIVFFAGLSQDPKRVWGIFHTNLLFFLGLARSSLLRSCKNHQRLLVNSDSESYSFQYLAFTGNFCLAYN